MAHLSTIENPWGKSFTSFRYIHPPFAENIVTAWPSSMVMIGEIPSENPQVSKLFTEEFGKGLNHPTENSSAVIFTIKRDSDLLFRLRDNRVYNKYTISHDFMPYKAVEYKTRKDGVPIHALVKDLDFIKFYQETFCDDSRVPTAYIKVTIENAFDFEQTVELGALVKTGPEFLFTGCMDPDGYYGYNPCRERWFAKEMTSFTKKNGYLTDGVYKLYYNKKAGFDFNTENDLNISLVLKPGEKRTFTFAFTRSEEKPKKYSVARKEAEAFWKKELSKAKNIPNKKGIEPLFNNFLSQFLQMFAMPKGVNYVIMRQGGLQRYHWPEADHMVWALCKIGGYSDYIDKALSHYFNELQIKEGSRKGEVWYPEVPHNSRTASALQMFANACESDSGFYDKYINNAMLAFDWIRREIDKSSTIEGAVSGIFPPGIASDNPFSGAQQWTGTDTLILIKLEIFKDFLKKVGDANYEEVNKVYLGYFNAMKGIFDKFVKEQEDSEYLILPRVPNPTPEILAELNKDAFGHLFISYLLASGVAGYGTKEAEKALKCYTAKGYTKNGLVGLTYRSTTGVGRTWYTTSPEKTRYIYYKKSGNLKECKKLIDALLKYNVTTEYYQGERYDDHDAYITPWIPNASGNGRLMYMLFDYYGSKEIK